MRGNSTQARDAGTERAQGVRELQEDTYFLDRDYALLVARQGRVIPVDGGRRLQLCYHDGPPFEEAPINLVSVPVSLFAEVFGAGNLPLPGFVHSTTTDDPAARANLERAFTDMLGEVRRHREATARQRARPLQRDSYFFSPRDAFLSAVQRHPVDLGHPTIFGLQVCWFDGESFDGMPENLQPLPCEQVAERLATSRLRPPRDLVFPQGTEPQLQRRLGDTFKALLDQAQAQADERWRELLSRVSTLAPAPRGDHLRVFLPTSRLTQVMQYASKGLARAFERLGHRALVSIEADAMERGDLKTHLERYLALRPDLVVNINHLDNQWLHPEVFNVTWWQDPMPEIAAGKPLPWRERDWVYSVAGGLDPLLQRCGAPRVTRQGFCVDSEVFHPDSRVQRRECMVFVGSSYRHKLKAGSGEAEAIRRLEELMERGERPQRAQLETVARDTGQDPHDLLWRLFGYVVRERTVRWMCELRPGAVAVYGRGWAEDPVVAPHFRGEVDHGEELAQIYQGATHALVPHPFDLNSQRMAEVGACGCIPVVYDCRALADEPHWERECLFFHDRAALADCFGKRPAGNPRRIGEVRSYEAFARRILAEVGWIGEGRE